MARNTQIVELDLRSGVLSNESGFNIGPRLKRSQNAIWQPYSSLDEQRRRILSMPSAPAPTPAIQLAFGGSDFPDTVLAITAAEDILPAKAFISAREQFTNKFLLYNGNDGSLLLNTNEVIVDRLNASGSIAYWPDIATPTVYASHPGLSNIYQITETGATNYVPDVTPGPEFAGCPAMIIHLDRLWVSRNRRVFYTDPFDPKQIRASSFVPFEDFVTSMFRASSSPVDAGAGIHLCIGLRNAVWVIDGDPTFGNAVARRLVAGNGIADQTCVCETAYGAVCMLTDGQIYLIPAGAQQAIPIGSPIRDQSRNFKFGEFPVSMHWFAPYVYICYADLNVIWIVDFTNGQEQPPRFWGPVTSFIAALFEPQPGRLLPPVGLYNEMFLASTGPTIYPVQLVVDTTGRQSVLTTGYVQVANHKIEIRRVVLETTRRLEDQVLTCRAHWADGTVAGFSRFIPKTDAGGPDTLARVIWDFSIQPVVSEFAWFEFVWETGVQPDVHRAYCEVRTQPAQDTNTPR